MMDVILMLSFIGVVFVIAALGSIWWGMVTLDPNAQKYWCAIGSHRWTFSHYHNDNPTMLVFKCKACKEESTWL